MLALAISISAAIGFIALAGIAVNGGVLMVRLLDLERRGHTPQQAAAEAARTRMRPVWVECAGFANSSAALSCAQIHRP